MAAFSTIAAVGLGAAGIGASISGSRRQARAVENAADNADATNLYIYNDTVRRNQFRNDLGNAALSRLGSEYGLIGGQNMQANTFGGGNPAGFNVMGGRGGAGFGVQNTPYGGMGSPFGGGTVFGNRASAQRFANPTGVSQPMPNPLAQNTPQAQTGGFNPFGNTPQTTPQGGDTGRFQGFYNSPDYQLTFNEGQKAIEGGAAARGGLLSGNTAKAVTQFGQNMAANQYGNYRNALNSISGTGQVANQSTTAAGQNYANQYGQNQMAIGQANANAAGQIYGGIANAAGFGLGAIGQNRGWF